MKPDYNIAVLISGRGSNLKSLIDNAKNYRVKSVISNKADALGLNFAKEAKIPCQSICRQDFSSLINFKAAILEELRSQAPNLVCLAGFMLVLQKEFIEAFPGRIINIHPSLLPAYPGLDTHQRVLQAREKFHGCSVHLVDYGVDSGPIIAQAKLEVLPNDNAETLAQRVLKLEHRLYPWVVNSLAAENIFVQGNKIHYQPQAINEAEENLFALPSYTAVL